MQFSALYSSYTQQPAYFQVLEVSVCGVVCVVCVCVCVVCVWV